MLSGAMMEFTTGSSCKRCLCLCKTGATAGRYGLNSVTSGKHRVEELLSDFSLYKFDLSILSNFSKASSTTVLEYPLLIR